MINLESSSLLSRYFVWSCDHLPLTQGHDLIEENGKKIERARPGSYYIKRGTTLCHIFWAVLWVPLGLVAIGGFILAVVSLMHFYIHQDFMKSHPDAGPLLDVAAYFLPEAFVAGFVLVTACIGLAILGGAKTGFFSLLWQYLKGIKQRICPLVRFGE